MALVIRMRQQGANSRQRFRIVLTDVRHPRDGKYMEKLGWYNPFEKEKNCFIDMDRLRFWVDLGAQVSPRVQSLVKAMAPDTANEISSKKVAKKEKARVKRRARAKKA